MSESPRRKRLLFLDDDAAFRETLRELFTAMSRGAWDIVTAENHAQALKHISHAPPDVVVLDIGMPVMDGIQFLRLLRRTHPAQQVVMLTGRSDDKNRATCHELGAALFLEKPTSPAGFEAVYAALDALAGDLPQVGFRGVMRRVGLTEVLQMECLGRKSSVLEVFTPQARGRIFVAEGDIVHAESGSLEGEMALYGLLGLEGGEFNLQPYTEPPRRTISGHYEFLLMEAARLGDEGTRFFDAKRPAAPREALPEPPTAEGIGGGAPESRSQPAIQEVLLCSGAGEVLHAWQCPALHSRLGVLQQIDELVADLNRLLPLGRLDRLELQSEQGRVVCQAQPHMRLFVRSTGSNPATG